MKPCQIATRDSRCRCHAPSVTKKYSLGPGTHWLIGSVAFSKSKCAIYLHGNCNRKLQVPPEECSWSTLPWLNHTHSLVQADDGRVCFRRPVSTWSSPLGCRVPVAPSLSEHASLFTRDYPYKITASLTVLIEDWDHPVGIERQKSIWREECAEYCAPRTMLYYCKKTKASNHTTVQK